MFFDQIPYFLQGMLQMFFIFAAIFLWVIPNKTRAQKLLFYAVAYWAFVQLKEFIFYDKSNVFVEDRIFIDLLGVPLSVFYGLEIIFPGKVTPKYMMKTLALFVIFNIIYWGQRIFISPLYFETISDVYHHISTTSILTALFCTYTLGYSLFNLLLVIRSSNVFKKSNRISDMHHGYQKWIVKIIYMFMIWLLLYFVLFVFGFQFYLSKVLFLLASLIIQSYAIVKIFRHESPKIIKSFWKIVQQENSAEEKELEHLKVSSPENKVYRNIAKRLETAFNDKKMYLNPKLTILDLANECQTNRTYISDFLNTELNTNFNDYVNLARIERVSQRMLMNNDLDYSIEEIAVASGFNSVSTFRRAFEKFTGETPLNFKNSNKDENWVVG